LKKKDRVKQISTKKPKAPKGKEGGAKDAKKAGGAKDAKGGAKDAKGAAPKKDAPAKK